MGKTRLDESASGEVEERHFARYMSPMLLARPSFICCALALVTSGALGCNTREVQSSAMPVVDAAAVITPQNRDAGRSMPADAGEAPQADASVATDYSCSVARVTSCDELGTSSEQAFGCCEADGSAVVCEDGKVRRGNCDAWGSRCTEVPAWDQVWCEPTGATAACSEVVAPTTSGEVLEFESLNFTWDMACWDDADRSLLVFLEDTAVVDVAMRFYIWAGEGIEEGDTVDLSEYSALAMPFFVETLSGVAFDEGGSYDGEFLAYSGTFTFTSFNTDSPVDSWMEIEINDFWAREIEPGSRTCTELEEGRRMHIEHLTYRVQIGALHHHGECIQWAGG